VNTDGAGHWPSAFGGRLNYASGDPVFYIVFNQGIALTLIFLDTGG
jgi:hypothetical protein